MAPPTRFRSRGRLVALLGVLAAGPVAAQSAPPSVFPSRVGATGAEATAVPPAAFGSSDDLYEFDGERRRDRAPAVQAAVFGGAAYLPDTWRGAVRGEVAVVRGLFSAAAAATLHPAAGGLYGPEADEAYDALRMVEHIRLDRAPGQPLYARLGPTERVTLGVGALARGYRTTTAWDERTLGAEAALDAGRLSVAAFADDLRLGGVVGGEVGVRIGRSVGPLGAVRLTVGAVHDLGLPARGDSALTGVEATLRGSLGAADAPFGIVPFVTAARYLGKGSAIGIGADAEAFRASTALRASARAALFVSTSRFVPGHVNPFYALSNADERIVSGDAPGDGAALAGTPLDSLDRGLDLVLDLRVVAFGRFEVAQHVRRHIGPDRASAYGLRLAARLPLRARAELAVERQGFRGLLGFLGSLGQENALVLDVTAPVGRGGQLFVRSRYGYRRLPAGGAAGDGPGRFLAERRFEPLVGVRLGLR